MQSASSKFQSTVLLGGPEGDSQGHSPSTPLDVLRSVGPRVPSECPFPGTLLHLAWSSLPVRTHGHHSRSFKKHKHAGPIQGDADPVVCDEFLTLCFFPCVSNVGTTDSIHHLEPLWKGQVGWGSEGRLTSHLWRVGETVVFLSTPRETPLHVSSGRMPTLV